MRLLVFLKDYPPNPSPNGHLTQMLLGELKRKHGEINIDVITARIDESLCAEEQEPSGIRVFRIPTGYEKYGELTKRILEEKNIIKKFFGRLYLKMTRSYVDRHFTDKYRHLPKKEAVALAKRLHRAEPYDAMLSVSHQFEAHLTALAFKKAFPDVRYIAYMMDPYADHASQKSRSRAIKREHAVFGAADCILATEPMMTKAVFSPLREYKDKLYTAYGNNLYDRTGTNIISEDAEKIHVVFSGQCTATRNPLGLFELWKYVDKTIVLHIYAGGDRAILDEARRMSEEVPNMIFHGYVPYDTLEEAHQRADVFVNVGWFVNTMIPSKIFDYMSFGKPIINLYSIDEDTTKPFLDKYPCGLSLKADVDNMEHNAEMITRFCREYKNTHLSYSEVCEGMGEFNLEKVADRFYRMMNDSFEGEKIQHFDCFK